jgi:broad specificity phosphatase PhoE
VDLLFVRHGQGEHGLNLPGSLNVEHPRLTPIGRAQLADLALHLRITHDDLFVVSPTRRTIESALILAGSHESRRCVTPLVGPRMFNPTPTSISLPCDQILDSLAVHADYPEFEVVEPRDPSLWRDGINRIANDEFQILGTRLIEWCKQQGHARVVVVAHDGTIHHYRRLLGETSLTRADALGEAGWHQASL